MTMYRESIMNSSTGQPKSIISEALDGKLLPAAATIIFIVVVSLLQIFKSSGSLSHIPSIGKKGWESSRRKEFMSDGAKLYDEGYHKYKNGIFRITTARESPCIVVAPRFLPELNKVPESTLSFFGAIQELMHTKHIDVYEDGMQFAHAVKNFITPSLGRLNPMISKALDQAIEAELPKSTSWTEVKVNDKVLRIIAKVSGRIFVGPELSCNEQYLDTSINFTIDLMKAVFTVAYLPVWLRSLLAPVNPFIRTVYRRKRDLNELLLPVVESRRLAARNDPLKEPEDMLDWLIMEQAKAGISNNNDLAAKQLGASFASIHTTTQTVIHILYTLSTNPDIVSLLQEEIREVLAKSGGEYTAQALQDMKKLDSFLRELLRFYPLQASTFQRKVIEPFSLSNGQVIPAGVIVEAPNGPICSDPEIFENPGVFDPLRFYNLRQNRDMASASSKRAEIVANGQFVSSGSLNLSWGYGRHACPGRFFASNEIKMITGKLLMQYEMRLPDGVTERYPNVTYGDLTMPDTGKTVMLRKV